MSFTYVICKQSVVNWTSLRSETWDSLRHPSGGDEDSPRVSSSFDDEGRDLLRHRVEDEDKKEREDGEDDQSDDVLLVLLPDEEDEGLHGVDKPGKAGRGTTGGTTGYSSHVCIWTFFKTSTIKIIISYIIYKQFTSCLFCNKWQKRINDTR